MTIRVSAVPSVAAALLRRLAELPRFVGQSTALVAGGLPLGRRGPPCVKTENGADVATQPW